MISSGQYKSYDFLSAEAKELFRINPLNPNIKIQILICRPYMFSSIRFIFCDQALNPHDRCVL